MSRVNSVSLSEKSGNFYLCGDYQESGAFSDTKAGYSPTFARLSDDGEVSWIMSLAGTHPLNDQGSNAFKAQDHCMAVTYDDESEVVTAIIQGKMSEVRATGKGDFYDTIIV